MVICKCMSNQAIKEIKEYYNKWKTFDWYYDRSEDSSVRRRGRDMYSEMMSHKDDNEIYQKIAKEFGDWKNNKRDTKPTISEFIPLSMIEESVLEDYPDPSTSSLEITDEIKTKMMADKIKELLK